MSASDNPGRFAPGAPSPNPAGRPRKSRAKLVTPSDFRQVILRVANMQVESKTAGETRMITLFEANIAQLGTGKVPSRLAAKNFADMVQSASYWESLPPPRRTPGA
jgi:hypothetical protein